MKNESTFLKNVEKLGDEYVRENISGLNRASLERDWWEAMKFFFSRSFMRGRRDKLSIKYANFATIALRDYFRLEEGASDAAYARLKAQRGHFGVSKSIKRKSLKEYPEFEALAAGNPVIGALISDREGLKNALPLRNVGDIVMVLEVLDFVTENDDHQNIYEYLVREIERNSSIRAVYRELDGIKFVGDKIASLIIRDILLLNPLPTIPEDEFELAFPVDTWVNRIAEKIGCKKDTIEKTKKCLIARARESGVNVFRFAAGLWYLGFNSLNILLDKCLGEIQL